MEVVIENIFIHQNVSLYFTEIDRFISTALALPAEFFDNYRTKGPVEFSAPTFHTDFLTSAEMNSVNRFKTLKKQLEWMAGRFCAKTLIASQAGLPLTEIAFAYEDEGAPYWTGDPKRSVSISHSGNFAGAALLDQINGSVGLDIELIRSDGIADIERVAFTPDEIEEAKTPELFFEKWTAKEAYLKYIRRGFHQPLKSIEYLGGTLSMNKEKMELSITTSLIDKEHIFTLIQP